MVRGLVGIAKCGRCNHGKLYESRTESRVDYDRLKNNKSRLQKLLT